MYGVGSEGGTKQIFSVKSMWVEILAFCLFAVVVVAAVVVDVVVECG